jgi:hypothetical protein
MELKLTLDEEGGGKGEIYIGEEREEKGREEEEEKRGEEEEEGWTWHGVMWREAVGGENLS